MKVHNTVVDYSLFSWVHDLYFTRSPQETWDWLGQLCRIWEWIRCYQGLANISPVRTACAVSVTYVTDLCVKAGMKQWPLSVDYLLVDIWVHFDCWYAISSTTMKPSFILVEMSFKINYVMSFGLPTKRDNILPDCCMKRFTDICV